MRHHSVKRCCRSFQISHVLGNIPPKLHFCVYFGEFTDHFLLYCCNYIKPNYACAISPSIILDRASNTFSDQGGLKIHPSPSLPHSPTEHPQCVIQETCDLWYIWSDVKVMRRHDLTKVIFQKCVFWKCIFWKCVFRNRIFWQYIGEKLFGAPTSSPHEL